MALILMAGAIQAEEGINRADFPVPGFLSFTLDLASGELFRNALHDAAEARFG